jgi:hypothetical protein
MALTSRKLRQLAVFSTTLLICCLYLTGLAEVSPQSRSSQTATGDDVPARVAANPNDAGRAAHYYLFPYNVHLTAGEVSAEPLVVRDGFGNVQDGSLVFFNYDTTLISVDSLGYVRALRAELSNEIGTWVQATFNGEYLNNSSVVRVLSRKYDLPYTEVVGDHTALYYPTEIGGEDIESLVNLYQIPLVDEYAYALESEYMGLVPFDSVRQIIEIDFGEGEESRVCGISGNPFRLGWNIQGNAWQNCFLVPFLAPRSPQWFVMYHEIGHNFTWPSYTFGWSIGPVGEYSEGIASVLALEAMQTILDHPSRYPINAPANASLALVIEMQRYNYKVNFQNWLNSGANFKDITPDIVDGIWLKYRDSIGVNFARRFFTPLQPKYQSEMTPILDSIAQSGSDASRHTLFAALVSGAFGQDLKITFINDYHYPIEQPLYTVMLSTVSEIMNGAAYLCGDADASADVNIGDAVYMICYIFSDCVAPPFSAADMNCDGEITISDVVYLINYIFNDGSAPCAMCK